MSHHSIHLRLLSPVAEGVELGDRDKPDWTKALVVSKNDFCHRYSTALELMGSVQHPIYTHPKMLGQCFDNVYHQGHLIGDLPAHGKNPTEAQTKKIYDQEYDEVTARIENSLDLSLQSTAYSMVLTSLLNPEIVLPPKAFREQQGLPEVPLGCIPQPRDYVFDGAQGLVDVSWSQRIPPIQLDDIDKNLLYNQYPYQEADDFDDDDKDMEVDERMPGNAGDACVAVSTGTWCLYHRPPASYATHTEQTPGSPWSIHTDTDTAMEFDTLKVTSRSVPPQGPARDLSAPDFVSHLTKVMADATATAIDRAQPLPVTDATDAALQERFQQRRVVATQHSNTQPPATGHISVFDRLEHRQTPQQEDPFMTLPEMTPRKVEKGHQPDRSQEPGRSTSQAAQESGRLTSQKRHSQSHPRDEADSKKGRTEGGTSQGHKVQVGIDWANTGIQKPVPKPDSQHPSFKPDPSGSTDSLPPPQIKSTVAAKLSKSQHSQPSQQSQPVGRRTTTPVESSASKVENKSCGLGPTKYPGNPEKREVKDKSYHWITACMARLDPKGFVEEINSFRHFAHNSKSFAFEIIAITDWDRRYMEFGFNYPIPMFPNYLFNRLTESRQIVRPSPMKLESIQDYGGDVRTQCTEAWTLMVSILQFWIDEETIKDGELFGSQIRPVSALAKYIMETINPHLEPDHKVTWEEVVHQTPWLRRHLVGSNSTEIKQICRQPIPVEGQSSELEIAMEECYNWELVWLEKPQEKVAKDKPGNSKTRLGRGQNLKIHLKRAMLGEGWSHVEQKDPGPDIGKKYEPPWKEESPPHTKPRRRKWWRCHFPLWWITAAEASQPVSPDCRTPCAGRRHYGHPQLWWRPRGAGGRGQYTTHGWCWNAGGESSSGFRTRGRPYRVWS